MNENPVLDVVDLSTLEFATASEHLANFKRTWGHAPSAVGLPLVSPGGIPFDNPFTSPRGVRYAGQTSEMFLGGIAHEFAKLGMNIVLTISPQLSFVRSDTLHIIDIKGVGSSQACLGKSATRRLLSELFKYGVEKLRGACESANKETGKNTRIEGVAFDVVDLWPMSAKDERIELTCFCKECREQLAALSKRGTKLVRTFEKFPNPWNLLLRDSGPGIEPISDIAWDVLPQALLDRSHLKGFDEILLKKDQDLHEDAEVLIDYLQARHKQVVSILEDLFGQLASLSDGKPFRRILIAEADMYSWTGGVFLQRLDDPTVCDELWIDPSALAFNTTRIANRAYMQRRCRYLLGHFFDFLYQCQDEEKRTVTGLARLSKEAVRSLLENRRRRATSSRLSSPLDLFCLNPLSGDAQRGRIGFVGQNLSDELGQKMTRNAKIVSSTSMEEMGPESTLEMLRSLLQEKPKP